MKPARRHFHLNVAGFCIRVFSNDSPTDPAGRAFTMINRNFKGFLCSESEHLPCYNISFIYDKTPSILYDRKSGRKYAYIYDQIKPNVIRCSYRISANQFELVIRHIIQSQIEKCGFILHSSSVMGKNGAYIFTGPPGAGKSTIIRLLKNRFQPLGDDSSIITKVKHGYRFHETPFSEAAYWIRKKNTETEIRGIFFLKKAGFFSVEKIGNKDLILRKMIDQTIGLFRSVNVTSNYISHQLASVTDFVNRYNRFYFLNFGKNSKELISLLENFE